MTTKENANTYDEYYSGGILRRRWDWGSSPRMYYEYDKDGGVVYSREFNAEENAAADSRESSEVQATERQTLLQQLAAGTADIQAAVDQATGDEQTADSYKNQADALKADATTQRTQIAGFTASATYSAAQLTAIKGQLDLLAARDQQFAQAFSDHYVWRGAVDASMVKVYNALLWVAKVVSGRLGN